ncbi:MAG: ABC transporter [Nitrososphaerota archaeon]
MSREPFTEPAQGAQLNTGWAEGAAMLAVEALELYKRYGKVVALNGLTASIPAGRVVCILGPNGAGKTTFLHIIATILKPTRGTVRVFGHDVMKEGARVRGLVGIAFQEPKLFWRFSPEEVLRLHARIHSIRDEGRIEEALRRLDLWNIRRRSVEFMSGGERKKVEIAKVLVQRPKLAIFDEPTTMIDVEGKHFIWDSIRAMVKEGSSVLVSTNEIYEAEVLADEVLLISRGRLIAMAEPRKLKEELVGGDHVELMLERVPDGRVIEGIRELSGALSLEVEGRRVFLKVLRYWNSLPFVLQYLADKGVRVLEVKVREPTLDDVLARLAK